MIKKFFIKHSQNIRKNYTVYPVYSGYLRFLKKVSAVTRCPLYRGFYLIFTGSKFREFCLFWIILRLLVPSRHTTSFQRLYNVYTTSGTSYRCRIDVETTSCVYWVSANIIVNLLIFEICEI